MAGERTLPGIGLTGFWTLGSSGWKPGMDTNLLQLSALVQLTATSRTVSLPGSPTQGMVYIVPASAGSNPNKIALYDNAAWVYLTPKTGSRAFIADETKFYYWSGSAWTVETVDVPVDAIGEAPIDGATYSRKDGDWIVVSPTVAVEEAPIDGVAYERKNGDWVAAGSSFSLGGDLSGTTGAAVVTKLQGISVSTTDPTSGQVLKFNGSSWAPGTDTSATSVTMTGDVTGASSSNVVAALQGIPVSTTDPTSGQVLKFDGSSWAPGTDASPTSVTMTGDVTGASGSNTVVALQGIGVSTTDPASGEILKFNGTSWAPAADSAGISDAPSDGSKYVRKDAGWVAETAAVTSVTMGGDISGASGSAVVVALQGIPVSTTDPSSGEVLKFDGTNWAPGTDASGSGGISDAPSDGTKYVRKDAAWVAETAAVTSVTLGGDVTGSSGSNTVTKIRGVNVVSTTPTSNQLLKFDGTNWTPATVSVGISDAPSDGTAYERKDAAWVAAYAGYDIPIYIPDKPTSSMLCARVAAVRAYTLPSGLTGSVASAGTAATASTVFTIYKNTTSVGTITFASSGSTGTFSMASSQSFASGDVLRIIAPSTADTTLADISISFLGTRT